MFRRYKEAEREVVSGDPVDLDLTRLSQGNYANHRQRRFFALAGGLAAGGALAVLGFLDLEFGTSHPGDQGAGAVLLAVSVLFAYYFISAGWWLYRAWAPPPVGISISGDGLVFHLQSGRARVVGWKQPGNQVDVVVRSTDPKIPPIAKVLVIATIGGNPARRPWAPVVPDAYLPESAVPSILRLARANGVYITQQSYLPALSLDRSRMWTLFRLTSTGVIPREPATRGSLPGTN